MAEVPSVAQAFAKVPEKKRKEVEAQKSGKKQLRVWSLQKKGFVKGFVKNGKLVVSKGKKPGSGRWMLRFVGNVVDPKKNEKFPFSVILTSGSTSSQSQSRSRSRTPRRSSKSPRSKPKSPRRSSKKRGSRSRSRSSSRRR